MVQYTRGGFLTGNSPLALHASFSGVTTIVQVIVADASTQRDVLYLSSVLLVINALGLKRLASPALQHIGDVISGHHRTRSIPITSNQASSARMSLRQACAWAV